jgi:hypothetical protein
MSKSDRGEEQTNTRRAFLKGVMLGGGAAAVALATGQVSAQTPETPAAVEPPEHKGYRLTPHIRDYYKTVAE